MKNLTKTFLILIFLTSILILLCHACKKDDNKSSGLNNNGNINASSCYILRLVDDAEEFIDLKFIYNNQTQLIRMDSREDDYHDYITMQYDNSGNIVKIEYYEDDGSMYAYQTFEYSDGKVTKGHQHTNNEAIYYYNYNTNGLLESINISSVTSLSLIKSLPINDQVGFLSSRILNLIRDCRNSDHNTQLYNATIKFQWNSSGSVTKESWYVGETLVESYDYTYDNKNNPFKILNFPVPIIAGSYSRTISSNNFTKQVWYSATNGESETSTVAYQYNGNGYPTSMIFDGSDKYRMEYECE